MVKGDKDQVDKSGLREDNAVDHEVVAEGKPLFGGPIAQWRGRSGVVMTFESYGKSDIFKSDQLQSNSSYQDVALQQNIVDDSAVHELIG